MEQEKHGPVTAVVPSWIFEQWPQQGPPCRRKSAAIIDLEDDLHKQIAASGQQVRLCLYDFATGKRIELEARRRLYPASMIKTLLLLAALEQVEQGKLLLESSYVLHESDKYAGRTPVTGTGTLQFAAAGSVYTFEELLRLMISLSDNVATNVIFEQIGAAGCAATAKRLGLKDSAFTRKIYDLESGLPSNVSTAYELTKMLLALQNRKAAGERLTRIGIGIMAATADKGRIGRFIKDRAVVANKVGTVGDIVGDMALLYFSYRPPLALAIVVEYPPDQEEAARLIGALAGRIVEALAGKERL